MLNNTKDILTLKELQKLLHIGKKHRSAIGAER